MWLLPHGWFIVFLSIFLTLLFLALLVGSNNIFLSIGLFDIPISNNSR